MEDFNKRAKNVLNINELFGKMKSRKEINDFFQHCGNKKSYLLRSLLSKLSSFQFRICISDHERRKEGIEHLKYTTNVVAANRTEWGSGAKEL
jgi:hypothetical protein